MDLLPYAPKIFPSRPHAFDAFIFKGSRCSSRPYNTQREGSYFLKNDIHLLNVFLFKKYIHTDFQSVAFLTGALVNIDANGPDELTPIFFKTM